MEEKNENLENNVEVVENDRGSLSLLDIGVSLFTTAGVLATGYVACKGAKKLGKGIKKGAKAVCAWWNKKKGRDQPEEDIEIKEEKSKK